MKLIASGVTNSAASVRSPSFSRSASSTTTTMRPARISATAPGTSVKGGSKVRAVSGIGSSILADGSGKRQKCRNRRQRCGFRFARHTPGTRKFGVFSEFTERIKDLAYRYELCADKTFRSFLIYSAPRSVLKIYEASHESDEFLPCRSGSVASSRPDWMRASQYSTKAPGQGHQANRSLMLAASVPAD